MIVQIVMHTFWKREKQKRTSSTSSLNRRSDTPNSHGRKKKRAYIALWGKSKNKRTQNKGKKKRERGGRR